ncbi:MAG: HEAT repeat domain-containing protein [Roseiflexaceae bacterium]
MEEQDHSVKETVTENGHGEPTQVGQVMRAPAQVTRELPAQTPAQQPQPRRAQAAAATTNAALRERLTALIAALGDPEHPLHQQAVQELVAVGDAAVPALNESLNPRRPWLTAYRATEALGQIGDGRATGPLIEALRHPNSNVRWGAVRALAAIGDARALLDLRRVARDDRGKTSWGEPVAGAAQSALDQMRSQNVLLRGAELIKTAIACVLMLVSLIFAWSVVTSLRTELNSIGRVAVTPMPLAAVSGTPGTTTEAGGSTAGATDATALPTEQPTAAPTATPALVVGTVLGTANVRNLPSTNGGTRIGTVNSGDEIIFLAATSDGGWYRIRLGERRAQNSQIGSSDGTGWVSATLLSPPTGQLPIETP